MPPAYLFHNITLAFITLSPPLAAAVSFDDAITPIIDTLDYH